MKRKLFVVAIMTMFVLSITACGTSQTPDESKNDKEGSHGSKIEATVDSTDEEVVTDTDEESVIEETIETTEDESVVEETITDADEDETDAERDNERQNKIDGSFDNHKDSGHALDTSDSNN